MIRLVTKAAQTAVAWDGVVIKAAKSSLSIVENPCRKTVRFNTKHVSSHMKESWKSGNCQLFKGVVHEEGRNVRKSYVILFVNPSNILLSNSRCFVVQISVHIESNCIKNCKRDSINFGYETIRSEQKYQIQERNTIRFRSDLTLMMTWLDSNS
jgi:hypothetical protein